MSAYEGTYAGNAQLRVTFDQVPVSKSCKAQTAMALYNPNEPNGWMQTWASMLLAAQAQNKQVKIFARSCINNAYQLYGVKVLP